MTIPGFTAEASLCRGAARSGTRASAADASDGFTLALRPLRASELVGFVGQGPAVADVVDTSRAALLALDLYGNWCGPGQSGPGAPIDPVDQVCCRHDRCYSSRGYFDCKCDRDLIAAMPAAIADSRTPAAGKAFGAAAAVTFAALPCLCYEKCLPFIGCAKIPPPIPGIPGLKLCPPGTA